MSENGMFQYAVQQLTDLEMELSFHQLKAFQTDFVLSGRDVRRLYDALYYLRTNGYGISIERDRLWNSVSRALRETLEDAVSGITDSVIDVLKGDICE